MSTQTECTTCSISGEPSILTNPCCRHVSDVFFPRHALQLRQAKLSFPRVHLLVGCCSDALCAQHKSAPAMTHAERCESLRHCRWADEILPDAPWVVDQSWWDKHKIDYIAHDELVYPSKDHEDVYAFAKKSGMSMAHLATG